MTVVIEMPKKKQRQRKKSYEEIVYAVARKHRRFASEAYFFVFDALSVAQKIVVAKRTPDGPELHVSGQELLEGIRRLARREFGYMAKTVFETWGVTTTEDFGRIVFDLVDAQLMHKTETDTIDDFRNSYDFDRAFESENLYLGEWKVGE